MVALTPSPIQRFVDNNGNALVGGLLFTYAAGTATKIAVYTDSSGGTAFPNPVVMNARGEPEGAMGQSLGIWLTPGTAYKYTLSPSTDTDPPTNPIWTIDDIVAPASSAGTYVAAFSFLGGTPAASLEVMGQHTFTQAVTFPGNFAAAFGYIDQNFLPTALVSAAITDQNGTGIGFMNVDTGGAFTFTSTSGNPVSFGAGQSIVFNAPVDADDTAANYSWTLLGAVS